MVKTALQLYSIRDALVNDYDDFARKMQMLADMGYEGVEPADTYGLTAKQMQKAVENAGLKVVSAHIAYTEMTANSDFYAEFFSSIGCKQLTIPHISREYLPDGELYPTFEEGVYKLSEKIKQCEMVLAYHNHDFEFEVQQDGKYLLDKLYETIPQEILQTQIDTCWVNVGGADPVIFVKKYKGRCPTVHLKDFSGSKGDGVPYALIGVEGSAPTNAGTFEFRPCGHGVQNMPAIVKAVEEAGALWQIVEQDNPSLNKSSLENVKMSIEYLKGLGK